MSKSEPVMPFGKHRGKPLSEVPRAYLMWLKKQGNLYGWLAAAVDAVLSGKPIPGTEEDRADKAERVTKPYTPSPGEPPPSWYHT